MDLVKAINDKCKIKYIGKRPGEKLNEEMISADDSSLKIDIGKFYVLVPSYKKKFFSKFIKKFKGKYLPSNFEYKSGQKDFMSIKELKILIKSLRDQKE